MMEVSMLLDGSTTINGISQEVKEPSMEKKKTVYLAVGECCWGRAHTISGAKKNAKAAGRSYRATPGRKGGWAVYAIENSDLNSVGLDTFGCLMSPTDSIVKHLTGPDPYKRKVKP
jgi:hypothetical protein